MKRVFLIVLDSFGIGNAPDAEQFGDMGSNTLASIAKSPEFFVPNMKKLGLFNIDGVSLGGGVENPMGAFGRLFEVSRGKDTTTGHWEIAGIIQRKAFPTFPEGFPKEIIEEFSRRTGRGVLCNRPYSGTEVLTDYGEEHLKTGDLIVYTSVDSVFQIAAHESIVLPEELYHYCQIARELLVGDCAVGRVIARPFAGEPGNFERTARRHDFSLAPTAETMLDVLKEQGLAIRAVGKISDIFAGKGISDTVSIVSNEDGMEKTMERQREDFTGLCFVNLVDFDMVYGHRNDVKGYAKAAAVFDRQLGEFMEGMQPEDVLMITADHGCDPGYPGSDHTREAVPLLIYGAQIRPGVNLGTRYCFADIGKSILKMFGLNGTIAGESFWEEIRDGR